MVHFIEKETRLKKTQSEMSNSKSEEKIIECYRCKQIGHFKNQLFVIRIYQKKAIKRIQCYIFEWKIQPG